jgi:hypothetical protein
VITVMETWFLRSEFVATAATVMQEMDDLVGPHAHGESDWCGHASFYQHIEQPDEVVVIYPWRSRHTHEALVEYEAPRLAAFMAQYCRSPRQIGYLSMLPVDVEEHDQ